MGIVVTIQDSLKVTWKIANHFFLSMTEENSSQIKSVVHQKGQFLNDMSYTSRNIKLSWSIESPLKMKTLFPFLMRDISFPVSLFAVEVDDNKILIFMTLLNVYAWKKKTILLNIFWSKNNLTFKFGQLWLLN